MKRKKVLISSCLLGEPVRYDGNENKLPLEKLTFLEQHYELVPLCPEVVGGLSVPREPAEIIGGDGADVINGRAKVITRDNTDVTKFFVQGAQAALQVCLKEGIELAILVERSPSCGTSFVYDGSFTKNRIVGAGVTSALLRSQNITVMSQFEI